VFFPVELVALADSGGWSGLGVGGESLRPGSVGGGCRICFIFLVWLFCSGMMGAVPVFLCPSALVSVGLGCGVAVLGVKAWFFWWCGVLVRFWWWGDGGGAHSVLLWPGVGCFGVGCWWR
jgi:hypothetical protein